MEGPQLGGGAPEVLVAAVDVHTVLEDDGRVSSPALGSDDTSGRRELLPEIVLQGTHSDYWRTWLWSAGTVTGNFTVLRGVGSM